MSHEEFTSECHPISRINRSNLDISFVSESRDMIIWRRERGMCLSLYRGWGKIGVRLSLTQLFLGANSNVGRWVTLVEEGVVGVEFG